MDQKQIEVWSDTLDRAEHSLLTLGLPEDAPLGLAHRQDDKLWLRVQIVAGNTGGRWAYWKAWLDADGRPGIGPNPQHQAVADLIFNGDVPHFIGMLGIPYSKIPGQSAIPAWVLIEPRMTGERIRRIIEEKPQVRYEKSKEIFDVDTQETKKI